MAIAMELEANPLSLRSRSRAFRREAREYRDLADRARGDRRELLLTCAEHADEEADRLLGLAQNAEQT